MVTNFCIPIFNQLKCSFGCLLGLRMSVLQCSLIYLYTWTERGQYNMSKLIVVHFGSLVRYLVHCATLGTLCVTWVPCVALSLSLKVL